jgi:hypothetical protein
MTRPWRSASCIDCRGDRASQGPLRCPACQDVRDIAEGIPQAVLERYCASIPVTAPAPDFRPEEYRDTSPDISPRLWAGLAEAGERGGTHVAIPSRRELDRRAASRPGPFIEHEGIFDPRRKR